MKNLFLFLLISYSSSCSNFDRDSSLTTINYCSILYTSCKDSMISDYQLLPISIREKSEAEILKLVSKKHFENNFRFEECQIIEFCEEAESLHWELPKYSLNYKWIFKNGLIESYCFTVALSQEGDLIEPIKLPNTIENKETEKLISKEEFEEILEAHNYKKNDFVEIRYDDINQILTLAVSEEAFFDYCLIEHEQVSIFNAHTGNQIIL